MLFLEDKYQNTLFSFIIKNSKDTQLIKFIFDEITEEKENFKINFLSICDKTLQLEDLIFLNRDPHHINQYYEYYFYTINFIVSTVYTYYKITSYPEIIASNFDKTNDFYQYFGYNYLTAAQHLPPPTINIQNTGIYYAPFLLLQLTVSLIPSIIVFSTKENLFHTEDTQRELIIQCIELVNFKANDETLISQQPSEEANIKPYDDIDNMYGNDEL